MQALIFSFLIPVLPYLIWRSYNREKKPQAGETALRYVIYTICVTLFSLIIMYPFCDEGTSFLVKVDSSVGFTLKYLFVQVLVSVLVAAVEWYFAEGKLHFQLDREQWRNTLPVRFVTKVLLPGGIYLLAAFVILLNVRLMFDGVLWGDEAFSVNTVQNGIPGILQIMHYWDSHPPLYYFWLRLWICLLGDTGWVYHLASLIPFIAGILVAITLFRKHFGNIPAAFFVVASGLAAPCVEYNLEVRMYALAFFAVAMAFYCSYRIISGGKLAWIFIVLWGLVAAYSHYYGLVICGILIVGTGVAVVLKFRKRTWIKAVIALVGYIVGYIPWMGELFWQTSNVAEYWWNDTIPPIGEAFTMVGAGSRFKGIVLGLLVLFTLVLLLAESGFFRMRREGEHIFIKIEKPSLKNWSDVTYTCVIGCLTIIGTLVAGYLLCYLVSPVLIGRYLYMLIAISMMVLAMASCGVLNLLRGLKGGKYLDRACSYGKVILVLVLCVLLSKGWEDYRAYSDRTMYEKQVTEEILALIGDVDKDVKMVNNQVPHLGWTVLAHYYPDNEIINAGCLDVEADRFWYFSVNFIDEGQISELAERGYILYGYGQKQLGKYPLILYYFEK